jgi:hypothetical protein
MSDQPNRSARLARVDRIVLEVLIDHGEAMLAEFDRDYSKGSGGAALSEEPLAIQLADVLWILESFLTCGDWRRVALALAIARRVEQRLRHEASDASAPPTA